MEYWRSTWRLVLSYEWGHPREGIFDFSTDTELATAIRAAQTDGRVRARRHFRRQEWIGPVPDHTCGRRLIDWPPTNTYECACGITHRWFRCHPCSIDEMIPEFGDGCTKVPWEQMGEHAGKRPNWWPAQPWERG